MNVYNVYTSIYVCIYLKENYKYGAIAKTWVLSFHSVLFTCCLLFHEKSCNQVMRITYATSCGCDKFWCQSVDSKLATMRQYFQQACLETTLCALYFEQTLTFRKINTYLEISGITFTQSFVTSVRSCDCLLSSYCLTICT